MNLKRLAFIAATVFGTLAAAGLVWQFRHLVGLFLLSLAAAATLRPVVDRLSTRLPRAWAILITYVLCAGIPALLVVAAANPALVELGQAADGFVVAYDRLWATWPNGTPAQQALVRWLPLPAELYSTFTGEQSTAAMRQVLGVTANVFSLLSSVGAVLLLSLYWSLDQARFERLWLSVLPTTRRARARSLWRDVESAVGTHARNDLTLSLAAGLLLGLGFYLMGVRYPTLLALGSALAWLVPWLGGVLVLISAALVGGLGLGGTPALSLAAGLYTLAVFAVLKYGVEARLTTRRRFSSLPVILLALGLWQAMGLVGLLIASPLATALQVLAGQLMPQASSAASVQVSEHIADLQDRLAGIQAELGAAEDEPPPELQSLVGRLQRLMSEASALAIAGPSSGPSAPRQ